MDATLSRRAVWAGTVDDWAPACAALDVVGDAQSARAVLQALFTPVEIVSDRGESRFTGYFEPTYQARLTPQPPYTEPIPARPNDLITANGEVYQLLSNGERRPYPTRAEITRMGVQPLAYAHPADVFFLQIQGSGRLLLPDGRTLRAVYSANNGHPFRSTANWLLQRGWISRGRSQHDRYSCVDGSDHAAACARSDECQSKICVLRFGTRRRSAFGSEGVIRGAADSAGVDGGRYRVFIRAACQCSCKRRLRVLGEIGRVYWSRKILAGRLRELCAVTSISGPVPKPAPQRIRSMRLADFGSYCLVRLRSGFVCKMLRRHPPLDRSSYRPKTQGMSHRDLTDKDKRAWAGSVPACDAFEGAARNPCREFASARRARVQLPNPIAYENILGAPEPAE